MPGTGSTAARLQPEQEPGQVAVPGGTVDHGRPQDRPVKSGAANLLLRGQPNLPRRRVKGRRHRGGGDEDGLRDADLLGGGDNARAVAEAQATRGRPGHHSVPRRTPRRDGGHHRGRQRSAAHHGPPPCGPPRGSGLAPGSDVRDGPPRGARSRRESRCRRRPGASSPPAGSVEELAVLPGQRRAVEVPLDIAAALPTHRLPLLRVGRDTDGCHQQSSSDRDSPARAPGRHGKTGDPARR